jgi:hypothetical protein
MTLLRGIRLLGLAVALAGCGLVRDVDLEPAAIPDGPLEALGAEASGPVIELGSGRTLGVGWRYSIYQSGEGWCTQLERASASSSSCGDLAPLDTAFGGVGFSGPSDGPAPVEGIVSNEVAEVWLEDSTGERFETTVMSLAAAGLDRKAFVGFGPENVPLVSVTALNADGDVLETFDLPDLP